MRRCFGGMLSWLLPALFGGCDAASTDTALGALMRVQAAQYIPGAMPAAADGPPVTQFSSASSKVFPGRSSLVLGQVPRSAQAVALAAEGDIGYWVRTPGVADLMLPNQLNFDARVSFSPRLPLGLLRLTVRAVDAGRHFGPPTTIQVQAEKLDGIPDKPLVVSLRWDAEADLDLRVVDAGGIEIWARKVSSSPPPPGTDPAAPRQGGVLDFDSNSQCVIDGRRLENIYWDLQPPPGHYQARVDTFSMCGEPIAYWTVEVRLGGSVIASARGTGQDSDTRFDHGPNAGLLALEFDVR